METTIIETHLHYNNACKSVIGFEVISEVVYVTGSDDIVLHLGQAIIIEGDLMDLTLKKAR